MKYCSKDDAHISKDDQGDKTLYNCDGDVLYRFDSSWADLQIWRALDFANEAYERGRLVGASMARHDMRKALGMD